MINIYGIKTCSSVQKAVKFCKDNNIEYTFVDVRATPLHEDKIKYFASKVDINLLFNHKGKKFQELGLKKLNLDEQGKLDWLMKENMLIKRPVIEYVKDNENKVLIAFNEAMYKEELLK